MKKRIALGFVLLGLSSFIPTFLSASADSAAVSAVMRAQTSADNQPSYRIHTTTTDPQGVVQINTVEYVKPDRFHMQMGLSGEIIVIGTDAYQRRGTGAWSKSPAEFGKMFAQSRGGGGFSKEVLAATVVTQIGPLNFEGKPAMLYGLVYTKDTIKSMSKLWISLADNLPRHGESDTEIPVTKIGGKSFGGKSHSVIVYEYNLNISIKAPI